jgi:hypothetical protein
MRQRASRTARSAERFGIATLAASLALASAAGCGFGGPAPFDPDNIAITYAPREMATAICTRAYDCCVAEQLMSNDAAGTDEASCERLSRDAFDNQLDAVARAEHNGRLTYHGDLLAACVANIRAASCDDLRRTNHLSGYDCGVTYLEPKVPPAHTCDMDEECIGGSCQRAEGETEGFCVVYGSAGDSCVDGARCATGFACNGNTHLCYAVSPDGAPCAAATECASGSCNASTTGGSATCGPPQPTMCFYSSGCAAAGSGAPAPESAALALGLVVLTLALRSRRLRASAICRGRRDG